MIVAGIGCRRGCRADEIVALVREAEALAGPVDALAAPAFKRDEPGLLEAALRLGLVVRFVTAEALSAAQEDCVTFSDVVERTTGFASIAEAAALAGGGSLVLPRIASDHATCAVASVP